MEHKYLDKIKSLEGPPKKVNIFSEKEIEMIKELYELLPERTYNKKQNIRKKAWEQNYTRRAGHVVCCRPCEKRYPLSVEHVPGAAR